MSPLELVLCSLSEATAIELHRDRDSQNFQELHRDAGDAGRTTGEARKLVEKQLGRSVVTPENYLQTKQEKQLKERKGKGKKPKEQCGPTLFDEIDG